MGVLVCVCIKWRTTRGGERQHINLTAPPPHTHTLSMNVNQFTFKLCVFSLIWTDWANDGDHRCLHLPRFLILAELAVVYSRLNNKKCNIINWKAIQAEPADNVRLRICLSFPLCSRPSDGWQTNTHFYDINIFPSHSRLPLCPCCSCGLFLSEHHWGKNWGYWPQHIFFDHHCLAMLVGVCVCVCETEREKEREGLWKWPCSHFSPCHRGVSTVQSSTPGAGLDWQNNLPPHFL